MSSQAGCRVRDASVSILRPTGSRHSRTSLQRFNRPPMVSSGQFRTVTSLPRHRSQVVETVSTNIAPVIKNVPRPENDARLVQYLETTFPPLKFPGPLAKRIMTHVSYIHASDGHNARLAFLGRRVLHAYFLLFLHSRQTSDNASTSRPRRDYDYEDVASRALNTYVLGEHVAARWGVLRAMRWNSSLVHSPGFAGRAEGQKYKEGFKDHLEDGDLEDDGWMRGLDKFGSTYKRSVGLYKVQGTTVEAIVGGIFHQFGGSVAHRLFHTRLLPHIYLPGRPDGLHDTLHEYSEEVCKLMGGPDAELLPDSDSSERLTRIAEEVHNSIA